MPEKPNIEPSATTPKNFNGVIKFDKKASSKLRRIMRKHLEGGAKGLSRTSKAKRRTGRYPEATSVRGDAIAKPAQPPLKFSNCEKYLGKPKHGSLIPGKKATVIKATYLQEDVEFALSRAYKDGKVDLGWDKAHLESQNEEIERENEQLRERIHQLEAKLSDKIGDWEADSAHNLTKTKELEKERNKAEAILNCATHRFTHKLKTCCVEAEILQLEEQVRENNKFYLEERKKHEAKSLQLEVRLKATKENRELERTKHKAIIRELEKELVILHDVEAHLTVCENNKKQLYKRIGELEQSEPPERGDIDGRE